MNGIPEIVVDAANGMFTGTLIFLFISMVQGRRRTASEAWAFAYFLGSVVFSLLLITAILPGPIEDIFSTTGFPIYIWGICLGEFLGQIITTGNVMLEYRISGDKK